VNCQRELHPHSNTDVVWWMCRHCQRVWNESVGSNWRPAQCPERNGNREGMIEGSTYHAAPERN